MENDKDDVLQCAPGEEIFEFFDSWRGRKPWVSYDYRDIDGELFTGRFRSLEKARKERDIWLEYKNKNNKD